MIEIKEISRTGFNIMFQRLAQSDCGSNSCLFGGRDKGGMRTNGGCMCYQDLSHDLMSAILARDKKIVEPLVNYAKLKSQELITKRNMNLSFIEPEAYNIIMETLKNAGITE